MTWSEASIADISSTIIDYRGKTPPKADGGIKLLTAKVIKDGTIDESRLEYISEETYSWWMRRGFPRKGDILITTEAPLGETARLRDDERIALAQRVILLRGDPRFIDQGYFFAALRSPLMQARLRQRATGTTVSGIKQRELRQVLVPLPPLPTQRKIAAILSAYDDLIQNNTRRIKLLEEMTQRVYREWFVDFRYPGHEGVPLVDSELGPIPEGWQIVPLGSVAKVDKGLSYKGAYLTDEGVPMANLKCFLVGGGFRRDGTKPYSGDFKSRHRIAPGDLIMANTDLTQAGGVIGSPAIVPRRGFENGGLISHHLFAIRCGDGELTKPVLFLMLADERFRSFARGRASGTTVLGFRASDCEDYHLLVPPPSVLSAFDELVAPQLRLVDILQDASETAGAARDLWLPRLISGEIDVDNLDIEIPEAA